MLQISVPSCIRSQQAATDFKDSSEDPCWSQQDCSLKCCQVYPSIYVFQVVIKSLRNSNQYSDNNEENVYTLHLPQFFNINCKIKILVDLFLIFGVYPSVTRICNVDDETIPVLLSSTNTMSGWRLIVTVSYKLYHRKIPKYNSHYPHHSWEYDHTTCHSFLIQVVCTNLLHRVFVYILAVPTLGIKNKWLTVSSFCKHIRHRETSVSYLSYCFDCISS